MEELKKIPCWGAWKYEECDKKPRKRLCNAKTGFYCGTDEKYRNQLITYADVSARLPFLNEMQGAGLVVPPGYAFIDLDHIDPNSELVKRVHELFGDTYSELSPSSTGEHIAFKVDPSKIPRKPDGKFDSDTYYTNNSRIGAEIYIGDVTNHFMTYTANAINDVPIIDCTEAFLIFEDEFMRKDQYNKEASTMQQGDGVYVKLDDMDIICTARKAKNKDKFIPLYDEGDISGYGSHSDADLAECCILAFYAGPNPDVIDRLHRKGALMRDKWEREDYRNATISKAIKSCNGHFYTGKRAMPDFIYEDDKGRKHVNCPRLANYFRENQNMISVRDNGRSGVQRFLYDKGCYRPYADEMIKGVIKKFITDCDENILVMRDVNEVFQQLITDLHFVSTDSLNSDEDVINFINGILNVKTMELSEHNPEFLSTIQLPCEWTGVATATPVFDAFLQKLTDGDVEVQELLLEFMGVCISNVKGWRMKKALFMVGPGDTGKSQLKALTEKLLGKGNFVAIDLGEIEARFGTGNIFGKRLAGSSDMSFMTVDELKAFKKCTGGDSLFAEFKGQNGFEFTYDGLLWFCMNRLPKFGGDDGEWVYNRIMQVDCKNVIPPDQQDKRLLDKLYEEREGIIFKAVMALKRLIDNGYRFIEPDAIKEARILYHNENNTVVAFWEDCMVLREGGKIKDACTTGRVYKVYREWCKDNNHGYAKTSKEFRDEVSKHLGVDYKELVVRRGKGGSYFKEYTVSEEMKDNYRKVYGYDDDFTEPLLSDLNDTGDSACAVSKPNGDSSKAS